MALQPGIARERVPDRGLPVNAARGAKRSRR